MRLTADSNTPAQATFTQSDSTVSGILNAPRNGCGFTGVTFQGTLRGNTLAGTIIGDRFQNAAATGTLSRTALEITLVNGVRIHSRRIDAPPSVEESVLAFFSRGERITIFTLHSSQRR
jgi:hypothetical protein